MGLFYVIYLDFMRQINIPDWLIIILWHIINFCFAAVLLIFIVLFLVLFERKYLAFFTRRKGPNRVGLNGCLQTAADGLKILFKENILPSGADKFLYFCAPLLFFSPIMAVYCLIPFAEDLTAYNSCCGVLLFMAILSLPPLGVLFAGYSSGNKYSLIGGIRSCVQSISSEIPVFIVLAGIVLLTGSMNLNEITKAQSGIFLNWNIFPSILGFIIFLICSLIIMNRIPFDFPEAESELTAGYNSEYSGMKFAMFFLGEYALTFIFSAFIAVLFLGGYNPPFGVYAADLLNLPLISGAIVKNIEQFFWLMIKTYILILIIMWFRAAYPRLRQSDAIEFCWYILIPLSVFNLFILCIIQIIRGCL